MTLREGLRNIKRKIIFFSSVNWIKTIYFNHKMFPYARAKKLPVLFYGKVKFAGLAGEVDIIGDIKLGMIGFGQKFEVTNKSKGTAKVTINGKLIFKGNFHFGLDCLLHIGENAYCELGDMSCLGSDVKLICLKKVTLGDWVRVGYESQIIDTNSHQMVNTLTGEKFVMIDEIALGNYNSISNRVSIMPGSKTLDNCVIASNSLLNKDYQFLGENILLGGMPAKLLKNNFNRDWKNEEASILKFMNVKD